MQMGVQCGACTSELPMSWAGWPREEIKWIRISFPDNMNNDGEKNREGTVAYLSPPLLGIRQYYQMQLLLPGWLADREITDGFLQ